MSGIVAGGTIDHRCEPPDPVNHEEHDRLFALAELINRQWWEGEKAIAAWRALPWYRRWRTPMPARMTSWGRTHNCSDQCRAYNPGTLWQCDCALVYAVTGVRWSLWSQTQQGSPPARLRRSADDTRTGAFIGGVVTGAMFL